MTPSITDEIVKKILNYDPKTGYAFESGFTKLLELAIKRRDEVTRYISQVDEWSTAELTEAIDADNKELLELARIVTTNQEKK